MKFSIKEAFKSAFRIFCQNFFVVFSLCVFSFVVVYVFFIPINYYFIAKNHFAFITSVAGVPLNITGIFLTGLSSSFTSFLLMSALLPAFTGSGIKFRNCFPNLKKVFNYLLGIMLMSILMLVPLFVSNSTLVKMLVLTVEAVILFRYFIFFAQEVLSGNSVLQSCRNSAKLISGNLCKLVLLFFLLGLTILTLMILTAIPIVLIAVLFGLQDSILFLIVTVIVFFVEGLIVTPFIKLVLVHVYTQLSLSKSNSLLKKTELETESNVTGSTEKELV